MNLRSTNFIFYCVFLFSSDAFATAPFYYGMISTAPRIEKKVLLTSNTNYFPLAADVNLGFIGITYSSSRDRNVFYSFDQKRSYFDKLGRDVHSWLEVNGISPSGQFIKFKLSYRSSLLKSPGTRKDLHVAMYARVVSCDQKLIAPPFQEELNLSERLERIPNTSQSHICQIEFQFLGNPGLEYQPRFSEPSEYLVRRSFSAHWNLYEDTIVVTSNSSNLIPKSSNGLAPNQISGPDRIAVPYKRSTKSNNGDLYDEGKARLAVDAGREFVQALTEYADTLLILSTEDNPTRAAFHNSYLTAEKQEKFNNWQKAIEEGAAHLPGRQLVKLHQEINLAYEYINHFERNTLRWNHSLFDELSNRYLP